MIELYQNALQEKGAVAFTVRVRPGVSVSTIRGVMDDGSIKIDIAAVPERGKANAELLRFLAEEFGVSKNTVVIVSGETSTVKAIRITR